MPNAANRIVLTCSVWKPAAVTTAKLFYFSVDVEFVHWVWFKEGSFIIQLSDIVIPIVNHTLGDVLQCFSVFVNVVPTQSYPSGQIVIIY